MKKITVLVVLLIFTTACTLTPAETAPPAQAFSPTVAIEATAAPPATATTISQTRTPTTAERIADQQATLSAISQATQTARKAGSGVNATALAADGPLEWNLIFDDFKYNAHGWQRGEISNDFWEGKRSITGAYIWKVDTVLQESFWWSSSAEGTDKSIYYVQVDARLAEGSSRNSCYGIIFGDTPDKTFRFLVCDNQRYTIDYWSKSDEWEDIKDWDDAPEIISSDWNQLAIEVNRQHAKFYINHTLIYEMDHEELDGGKSGVFISKYNKQSAVFEFDNFVFRWPSTEQIAEIPVEATSTKAFCYDWSEVNPAMIGQTICVSGIIHVNTYVAGSTTQIRFSADENAFFLSGGTYYYPNADRGDCVRAEGLVLANTYGVPYIDIDEVLYSCD